MAAAPHGGNNGGIPAAAGLHVYHRCFKRQLRVLDAKTARLELQLKDCCALREELDKARAKRDKIYQHLNQQEMIQGTNSGGGGGAAPPPPHADEASPPHADEAPPPPPPPPPHADEAPPPPADDAMSSK